MIKKIVIIAVFSLFLLYSSLLLPKTHIVHNHEEMKTIDFGYPFSFITQDFSKYDPPFPWHYDNFGMSLEIHTEINEVRFILSYLTIFIVIFALDYSLEKLLHKKDGKR